MARPLRIEFPGAVYHITSRGNAGQSIFRDDQDRVNFLGILKETIKRFNWCLHAYCLMENHYHLVVETVDGKLSQGMRHLNGVYTQRFNRRHQQTGHIFQGRYGSILVDRQSHLLEVCRYVVLNPVRAAIVQEPAKWPWSSYRATSGLGGRPTFLTTDWVLAQFDEDRREAQKRYRRFVASGISQPSPWQELQGRFILGGREFLERITPLLQDRSRIQEVPKLERFASRPPLDDLLGEKMQRDKARRNQAVVSAHLEYGYTLSEIAKILGLHYTTVSKIVGKAMEQTGDSRPDKRN
ncbi:MAG: transposase [Deltaproteobacteria bacterium]|nr:transposase [Deltaproteobacteria bacterium]